MVIVLDASKIDPFTLLGILNSQVFWRFLRLTTPYMGTGPQVLRPADVRRFPIPRANDGRTTSFVQPYRSSRAESDDW